MSFHNDGAYAYSAEELTSTIAVLRVDKNTGAPRNFMIDASGELVLIANRDNNHIVVFRRDSLTGTLNYTGTELIVPLAVCVTHIMVN